MSSFAKQLNAAMAEQTRRIEEKRSPKPPDLKRSPEERPIKPTTHDFQTPAERKQKPTIAAPGMGGMFGSAKPPPRPVHNAAQQPDAVAKTPAITISRLEQAPASKQPRPSFRAAASLEIPNKRDLALSPERVAALEERQKKLAERLQKSANGLEASQPSKGRTR